MVVIHIITHNNKTAKKTSNYLVENKLMLDPFIVNNTDSQSLIIGRTKGLLFKSIHEEICKMNIKKMPIIYSSPIINMDWDQSEILQNTLKQV